MKKYTLIETDKDIFIQPKEYIDDGWYIKCIESSFILYEVSIGKEDEYIGIYTSITEALKEANELT